MFFKRIKKKKVRKENKREKEKKGRMGSRKEGRTDGYENPRVLMITIKK